MVNLATVLSVAATLANVNAAEAPRPAPAPLPSGTVIVKVMPAARAHEEHKKSAGNAKTYDGNYEIDGDMLQEKTKSPDERYAEMKAKLDERFAYMFELKDEIEKHNSLSNAMWEEYHALREAYERQLKKIIADWVTELNYAG